MMPQPKTDGATAHEGGSEQAKHGKLMVRCVRAHERCDYSFNADCPYCEPVIPLRYEDGTFAPAAGAPDEH